MKKIIVAFIAVLYMGISSGVAMEIHYCMGKKAGVEFYGGDSDQCGKCGMKGKKGGCCNDEHQFYKLNEAHKTVFNDISFATGYVAIVTNYPLYTCLFATDVSTKAVQNHSPPVYSKPSACILNCVFRL